MADLWLAGMAEATAAVASVQAQGRAEVQNLTSQLQHEQVRARQRACIC